MTKHTQGKWEIVQDLDFETEFYIEDSNGIGIACIECYKRSPEEIEANANLIASAPDMLEALELASKYLAKAVADNVLQGCSVPVEKALRTIEATIKQARGE